MRDINTLHGKMRNYPAGDGHLEYMEYSGKREESYGGDEKLHWTLVHDVFSWSDSHFPTSL
jgi:hypothetical protein